MNVSDTIQRAIANGMSQRELARLTGESEQHISGFKKGTRPCSYQRHAQIAAAAGLEERATRILIEGMAESLDDNSPHEKQAKVGLLAMLDAFPEEKSTISAAPSKGAPARGVATDKPRLRKSLRTSMRRLRCRLKVGTKYRGKNRAIGPFFTSGLCAED